LKHFWNPFRTEKKTHVLLVQINKTKQNRTHQIEHIERKLKKSNHLSSLRDLGRKGDSNPHLKIKQSIPNPRESTWMSHESKKIDRDEKTWQNLKEMKLS